VDTKSPAWNKGIIQCSGTAKEVAKAYSAEFKTDMDNFLNARAQEIIGGRLMVIIIAGLPDGILMSQTGAGIFNDFFGSCLIDMAKIVSNNIWLGLLWAGGLRGSFYFFNEQ